jgi:hypothetical protein
MPKSTTSLDWDDVFIRLINVILCSAFGSARSRRYCCIDLELEQWSLLINNVLRKLCTGPFPSNTPRHSLMLLMQIDMLPPRSTVKLQAAFAFVATLYGVASSSTLQSTSKSLGFRPTSITLSTHGSSQWHHFFVAAASPSVVRYCRIRRLRLCIQRHLVFWMPPWVVKLKHALLSFSTLADFFFVPSPSLFRFCSWSAECWFGWAHYFDIGLSFMQSLMMSLVKSFAVKLFHGAIP